MIYVTYINLCYGSFQAMNDLPKGVWSNFAKTNFKMFQAHIRFSATHSKRLPCFLVMHTLVISFLLFYVFYTENIQKIFLLPDSKV